MPSSEEADLLERVQALRPGFNAMHYTGMAGYWYDFSDSPIVAGTFATLGDLCRAALVKIEEATDATA